MTETEHGVTTRAKNEKDILLFVSFRVDSISDTRELTMKS